MKKRLFIVYMFGLVALIVGVFLRVTVVAHADETTTELFTSEEEQTVNQLLNEGGLTPDQHQQLLNAGRRFLEENQLATSTDALEEFDNHDYLTFSSDYEYIASTDSLLHAFNEMCRLLLSIRNLLLVLICGLVVVFVHSSMKKIIQRLTKGGVK